MKKTALILFSCSTLLLGTAHTAQLALSSEYTEAASAFQRGEFEVAAQKMSRLEKSGDISAKAALSLMYLQGRGVPKNIHMANELSKFAAAEGSPLAQHVQGLLNSEIDGFPKNYAEAIRWFTRAAEQEYLESQANLGVIYLEGLWTKQDIPLGVAWTKKAAERGFAPAQDNLGRIYFEGVGTTADIQQALRWWKSAAKQGFAKSLNVLGAIYFEGNGVPKNQVAAYAFFDIAGKRGYEMARVNQAALQPKLSQEELKQALQLSKSWEPGRPLPSQ